MDEIAGKKGRLNDLWVSALDKFMARGEEKKSSAKKKTGKAKSKKGKR